MAGGHTVNGWSSTQAVIALSSGEAELLAAVTTSSEAIGMMQMAGELGIESSAEVKLDSRAALGVLGFDIFREIRSTEKIIFFLTKQVSLMPLE